MSGDDALLEAVLVEITAHEAALMEAAESCRRLALLMAERLKGETDEATARRIGDTARIAWDGFASVGALVGATAIWRGERQA